MNIHLVAVGTHRSASRSRGISKGAVITVVAVLLLVAAVIGWFQLRERSTQQAGAAAAECVEGDATLNVTVDPEIEAQVRAAAERYNATEPKVRDHCASVSVTVQPSAAVAGALASDAWDPALGPQPGLWIADSTRTVESVRVPGLIEGQPASIASSPIVLAVPDELRQALEQARTTWADLPRLQQGSLGDIGLNGWGGLGLALPAGDTTLAVATAVASAVSGTEPLTEEAARSGQAVAAVSGLAAGAPESPDAAAALDTIASATPADADTHAIALTQRQLDARGGATPFFPIGAGPVADYPAALMSGPWVDKTQNLIAGLFAKFLRDPEQTKEFTDAGFAPPPAAPVPPAPRAALDAVRESLANPVLGVSATVLVDVSSSMSTSEGVSTRMTNAIGALASTVNVMPPDFGLGIWTFGKNLDSGDPYRIQAETALLTDEHRTQVLGSLGDIRPTSTRADECYTTLLAAYRSAVQGYSQGRTNSILLITDGPDDDSALSGPALLDKIEELSDPASPVRIDVVVAGGEGTETLRALTERTGGRYTVLPSSDDLEFGTAIVQALTTP